MRISANKLAEYLTSSNPIRRRAIVRDQKADSKPPALRYKDAYGPIETFLCDGRSESKLLTSIAQLRANKVGTPYAVEGRGLAADALESFLSMTGMLTEDCIYQRGPHQAKKLVFADVEVSVRPDFLVRLSKKGKLYIGALKFHFTKNDETALNDKAAQYVAALLHRWLDEFGSKGLTPLRDQCLAVDPYRQRVVRAPTSYFKRLQEIEAACAEIAGQWPQL